MTELVQNGSLCPVQEEVKSMDLSRTQTARLQSTGKTLYLITPHARNFPIDDQADYIGIDSGVYRIMEAGLPVLRALGDFDSLEEGETIPEESILYPVRKDYSDSELAMKLAMEFDSIHPYESIILWGGISGRLDHTYANLRLISYRFNKIILEDEMQKAWILNEGVHEIPSNADHISFFSIGESTISLENFQYPLDHHFLSESSVLTLSNHFLNERAGIVTIDSGRLLCIQSRFT